MPRPIAAHLYLSALHHNLQRLQGIARTAHVFAVVKANAYGHGIERLYPVLQHAPGIATLDFNEALVLRNLGYRKPILMLEGVFEARDLELCSRLHLWHCVHTTEQIDWIAQCKAAAQGGHTVFLKLNSGMNRLGFAPHLYAAQWHRLQRLSQIDRVYHMSHFAQGESAVVSQDARQCIANTTSNLNGPGSFCNSAALLCQTDEEPWILGDWVRCGIALYGASPDYPSHQADDFNLQPVMGLNSQIVSIQELRAGASVGYGANFTALADMTIGIVACGYADGYPRHAPSGTPVLVEGTLCPSLGRVSMDMLAIDLRPAIQAALQHAHAQPHFGSAVTLWGPSVCGKHQLPVEAVAHCADTVSYELLCAVSQRVPFTVHPALGTSF